MFKKWLNKILYEEVEVEEETPDVTESSPATVASKPITLEKEDTGYTMTSKPAIEPEKKPLETKPQSTETANNHKTAYITLPSEDKTSAESSLTTNEPVKASTKAEPSYAPHKVISPLFGYAEDSKSHPEAAAQLSSLKTTATEDEQAVDHSVLGMVFSPVYGSTKAVENVTEDEIDPHIASMTVQDIISTPTADKTADIISPIAGVEPKVNQPISSKPADVSTTKPELQPIKVIAPSGNDDLRKLAGQLTGEYEKTASTTKEENMSLFDDEEH